MKSEVAPQSKILSTPDPFSAAGSGAAVSPERQEAAVVAPRPPTAKALIIEEVQRLLRDFPEQFMVHLSSNDFYSVMVRICGEIVSPEGAQTRIQLFYGKPAGSKPETISIDIFPRIVPNSGQLLPFNSSIYRLDILTGEQLATQFEKLTDLFRGLGIPQHTIDNLGYMRRSDGSTVQLSSQWAETIISDETALTDLAAVRSVQRPDGAWACSLKDFLEKPGNTEGAKLLTLRM